jgi:hypothetical protein
MADVFISYSKADHSVALKLSAFLKAEGWTVWWAGNFSSVPGESDLLLRNSSTGGLQVYNINNDQLRGTAFIGTVGLSIAGPSRA